MLWREVGAILTNNQRSRVRVTLLAPGNRRILLDAAVVFLSDFMLDTDENGCVLGLTMGMKCDKIYYL